MRGSLITSFALHGLVVAFAAVGLPRWWDPRVAEPVPVMLELVTVAEKTAVKAEEKKPEPKPEPKKEEPKPVPVAEKEVPKPPDPPKEAAPPLPRRVEAPPPPPPPAAPTREAKPEAPPPPEKKPEVAEKKPEPEPEPEKKAEPEKQPEPKVVQAPRPMSKPVLEKPTEPEKEKPKFDLNQIQALLDKRQSPESADRVEARKRSEDAAPKRQQLAATASQMTMSEIDAIRAQIAKCWNLPAGAKDVENMRVQVRVYLRPDGSLERAPDLVDNPLFAGDQFYRTFAESARRAVQICTPLRGLPVEKYEHWRELTINFDPREMLGG